VEFFVAGFSGKETQFAIQAIVAGLAAKPESVGGFSDLDSGQEPEVEKGDGIFRGDSNDPGEIHEGRTEAVYVLEPV
jgi:hypothetical protein